MSNNTISNLHYWLAALYLADIGPLTFLRLLEYFVTIENIFAASQEELTALGLTSNQTNSLLHPNWSAVENDLQWLQTNKNHHILPLASDDYPSLLKQITDPPLILFVIGDKTILQSQQLAMVGARSATPTGIGTAEHFARALAQAGITITSGLALGIDGASHQGAISANGKTIAVIGSGFNHIYPRTHKTLAHEISHRHGALVSEFSLNQKPLACHFPRRNRIIAGMSLGVLVVEAALKSGSLITARHAVENGRDVFAIPGLIHQPLSRGCHFLIKQGAKLIETPEDVLEEIGIESHNYHPARNRNVQNVTLSLSEQQVLDQVGYEVTAIDTIIMQSRLTTHEVSSILLALELQGHIQVVTGGYVRTVS